MKKFQNHLASGSHSADICQSLDRCPVVPKTMFTVCPFWSCQQFIINFWLQVAIVQALLKPQWVSNEPNQQSQSLPFKKSLPWPPSYTWGCTCTATTRGFQISPIADILCGGVIAHFQAVRDVRPPLTSPSVDLRHPPAVSATAQG